MSIVLSYILSAIVPLVMKTTMYYGVFRWRVIPATLLSCIVIAGSGVLVSLIPFLFIPAPIVVIGLATYLCSKYTNIQFFPDAFVIALVVEVVAHVLLRYIIFPIIT
ncbi:MAG: hypothetical protein HYR76_12015 [Ignavibacteria bacterium]|nr:hypothetical protein [Ignavibacteria bacterium]MBI3765408.1 hypothetical protein [Ignavibacteriales bacterium]